MQDTVQQQEKKAGKFDPNRLTFQDGVDRIERALSKAGLKSGDAIVTSRDPHWQKLVEELRVTNIPPEFEKWQLPFVLESTQMYISVGHPNAKVGEHSHDNGNGLRFIASGSINYNGKELTAGDWMFIPKGKPYSFEVGPKGATMFYCYQCSCA